MLKGKKGLIIGIANDSSVAWGVAKQMKQAGAELAITYLNDKAEKYVRPLAESLNSSIIEPLNVLDESEVENLFDKIKEKWGQLDFVFYSVAFAPKEELNGRMIDSTSKGFALAMDISCHSFIRIIKKSEPLMNEGGAILTVSYYGAEKVVGNYSIMGPIKSALESSVRYAAVELGEKGISVNAISTGLIRTRASSGVKDFQSLLKKAEDKTPTKKLINIDDIGKYATFLVSDTGKLVTGDILYLDGGLHLKA